MTTVPDAPLNSGLEEIGERECLELLETEEIGRIAVVSHGQPEIFPVAYALDTAGSVVFRTSDGTKLAAALNRPVCFEVDHVEREARSGWSVVVHGVAHHTENVAHGSRRLAAWLPGRTYLVRITRKSMTGRRLRAAAKTHIQETHR